MTGYETVFTPLQSLAGGVLIGLAAVMLMAFQGRIMGATGILSGLIPGGPVAERGWRAAMVAGMIAGPLVLLAATGEMPELTVPVSWPMIVVGGFIVGVGVSFSAGCTSGHGVCGLARRSPRSAVATVTFMVTCAVTVHVVRHVIGG